MLWTAIVSVTESGSDRIERQVTRSERRQLSARRAFRSRRYVSVDNTFFDPAHPLRNWQSRRRRPGSSLTTTEFAISSRTMLW